MSRKRSASSIFDDEDEEQSPSRTTSQYRRVRSISNVIDDEQSSSSWSTTTPSRRNPSRIRSIGIVIEDDDEETMNQGSQSTIAGALHELNIQQETSYISDQYDEQYRRESSTFPIEIIEPSDDDIQEQQEEHDNTSIPLFEAIETSDDEAQDDLEFDFLPRQRIRKYRNSKKSVITTSDEGDDRSKTDDDKSSEFTTEEDINSDTSQTVSDSNDDEYYDVFEDYSPPNYEPFQDPLFSETVDDRFLWILLWILSFRTRFNITETAIDVLIRFMKIVLCEISGDEFSPFPDLIYLAKKAIGIKDQFHSFVPYPKCYKLHQK